MKLIVLTDENVVRGVYNEIYSPTIYPDGERIVFANGKIENIGDNYLLVENHIPVTVGQQLDDSFRDYDQSHNFIHMDIGEKIEEIVEDVKEELKEMFSDDESKKEED